MLCLSEALLDEAEFAQLVNRIDGGGCPAVLSGLETVHKAHVAAALRQVTQRPLFLICPDEAEAERLALDISTLTGENAEVLGSREFNFYPSESVSRQSEQKRIAVLYRLRKSGCKIAVATAEAMLQRTMPPETLEKASMMLKVGEEYRIEDITDTLVRAGYTRCDMVESTGQFALRGGILDFATPEFEQPVRCEFFGDEIDSMGIFDVQTQRRTENINQAEILPVAECFEGICGEEKLKAGISKILSQIRSKAAKNLIENLEADLERIGNGSFSAVTDRYMELIYPEEVSALSYIPEDAIVLLCDSRRCNERAEGFEKQLANDIETLIQSGELYGRLCKFALSWQYVLASLTENPLIYLENIEMHTYMLPAKAFLNISATRLPSYGGSLETATDDIRHYVNNGYRVLVLCSDERRAGIMCEYLKNQKINASLDYTMAKLPPRGSVVLGTGALSAGFEYPAIRFALITEGQLVRTAKKEKTKRGKIQSYTDLSPGDLVVHEHHGIGRFVGIFKMQIDGAEKDYIKIAYAGTDSLYVPATQLNLVTKYIGGGEDSNVRLSKMGGVEWKKTKARAKHAAKEMAKELIQLYAARSREKGYAFSPDSSWQTEFEDRFDFQETDDQLKAVAEIKKDMESSVPMDRLLCGDVGYGKTEVALRAVMKCVLDGKQAAILVPTTVLAQQHYTTAMRRFAGYPVDIEVLSRFKTAAQLKESLRKIRSGTADIVIGTHKLIQKDVNFKDLGLLIVDEEQRFGVSHKEKLKELFKKVDVLTLSATPIPRTLNMAMSGIRDMSVLEEPPQGRRPVQTYVVEHDWIVIADAIRREIERGGQVYYLHNRVESIDGTAAAISRMFEGVSVEVAHGQMGEEALSRVMEKMVSGEAQILVCTTIIETGIDIPNVNTLIIEDADSLGLAQLHQLRGRIGRSSRRAYAYLTFRKGKALSEVAEKRLSAIREFAQFNSGFRIAMRDLEIRGVGNLLGSEQSGHMISVGYDMYLRLLEEAVLEEKGEKIQTKTECSADLAVSANIPEKYVRSGEQRMDLYRRIAQITCEEDADDIIDELIDRYGDLPSSVSTLIQVAILRSEASKVDISEITQKAERLFFTLSNFDMEKVSALYSLPEFKNRIKIEAGNKPMISLKLKGTRSAETMQQAMTLVKKYSEL